MGVRRKAAGVLVPVVVLALAVAAAAMAAGFKPVKTYPTVTGGDTLDVVIADFSGDGKPDLALSDRATDKVSILRGNGTGNFGVSHGYRAGAQPLGLLVGDWNGDGRNDLAAANQSAAGGVTIMLNTGNGFSKRTFPAGPGSSYVLAARFTADQRPDLAVSNIDANTVSILRGKANGTFVKIGDLPTGPNPFGIAVGDFNRDGKRDVAAINDRPSSGTRVSVFLGNGDGTFKAPLSSPAGSGANEMVVSMFNGDSIPDLAVTDYSSDAVDILIGKGDGQFRAPKVFPAGDVPAEIALGDFTHDGRTDLAVSDSGTAGRVAILPRRAGLDFGGPLKYKVGSSPYGIAAGRLNADNRPDVATANFVGSSSVLLGN
jgi:FG-GAP-like repeat